MRTVFIAEGHLVAVDDKVIADMSRDELIEVLEDCVDQVLTFQALMQRGEIQAKELN